MLARRVSARDSGKPMVDAAFGEVMVTCEKLAWLAREGERHLRPERRSAGAMVGPQPLQGLSFTLSQSCRRARASATCAPSGAAQAPRWGPPTLEGFSHYPATQLLGF